MWPEVGKYLEQHKITPKVYEHPPVFSVKEAVIHCKHIPGMHCKNLFLKEKENNRPQFYLVIMNAHKRLNIKDLAKIINVKKLTFANEQELFYGLKLKPGSVSPLGLINDAENGVNVVIDEEVWNAESVNFHPNINNASMVFTKEQFHKLIDTFENEKIIVALI